MKKNPYRTQSFLHIQATKIKEDEERLRNCLVLYCRMVFKKCFFYLLVLYGCLVNGQQLQFNYIGDKLGLPAHECYNVMQDNKGYIWISTEAGLCRYNGTYSKVFDKSNGLPENSCYAVSEDAKGRLWILTSANRILNYVNGNLQEANFSEKISAGLKSDQGYSLGFKDDSIIVNAHDITNICSANSNAVLRLLPDSSCSYYFIKQANGLMSIKSASNRILAEELAKKNKIVLVIKTEGKTERINIPYKYKGRPSWRVLTATNKKGESFITMGALLIKLTADLSYSIYELPAEVICLYSDKDDGLWVGPLKSGVYYYPNTTTMQNKTENLKGYSITGVCVDAEKGVWCTTLEKSVFYSKNKNVTNYNNEPGLGKQADLLKYESRKIFASTGNSELIELNKEGIKKNKLNLIRDYEIDDILKTDNGWIIAGKNFVVETNSLFSNIQYVKSKQNNLFVGANQLTFIDNKRIFGVQSGWIFEKEGAKALQRKEPLLSVGKCLLYTTSGELLFGCKDGLYKMIIEASGNNKQYNTQKINGINGNVVKIIESSKHEIWVATKENGLFVLKENKGINVTKAIQLPTERCFDIIEDRFGTIWVGTYLGLIKIKNGKCTRYNMPNGLLANEILKVAADSNYIYISTTEGLNRLPLDEDLSNTIAPKIYLNAIEINGRKTEDLKQPFSYKENSLTIKVDVLSFKNIGQPSFYYHLKSKKNNNLKSDTLTGNALELNNLPPNNYELEIFAVNNEDVRSIEPIVLKFEIQKPFWQSIWFILICLFGVGLIIFVSVKKIVKSIRKKEEEKTQINKQLAEFQLTALQAQMNPHFIFNAINSVQRYILERSKQEAYDYLAKFGKLIRMVLNNSEEKILPLQQELEMLKLYVELEQMRFNNSFEFKIKIAKNVDPFEMQIPAMLIQPYIENAIWHGLMNLGNERKGILKVDIELTGGLLKITIEDNGIGRKRAEQYKQASVHSPKAMKLTEKRLLMINQMKNYESAKVLINDLEQGTRVEIFIPI